MARRAASPPPPRPPDFPPEKTDFALRQQLAELEKLRGRRYDEAETDERQWMNFTLNILIHGFGEKSENVSHFHHAKWAGEHHMGGMSPGLMQRNFDRRIEAFAALMKSSLAELKLMMPEQRIAGAYESGDDYQFYRDLRTIVGFATRELFIVDSYLDTQLFDLYVQDVGSTVRIRVLTDQVRAPLVAVAAKFAKGHNFEFRSSKEVHDRVVFADDRCWVIGQSIKDAAARKPTYIVEFPHAADLRKIYEPIWTSAVPIL